MLLLAACSKAPQAESVEETEPDFLGSSAFQDCHAPQYADWMTSDHALAMQIAHDETVLGDFEVRTENATSN